MDIPSPEHLSRADEIIRKTHGFIFDSCPAVINGDKGYLGVSRLAWFRVWFDYTGGTRTFLTCMNKNKALAKYHELNQEYGV